MRILHVSFSKSGGAGRAANLISSQLAALGHESKFIYLCESGLSSEFYKHPLISGAAIFDNYFITQRRNTSLFSILRDKLSADLLFEEYDVIHLHWTPGIFSQNDLINLSKLNKKIVWTLHDMLPITGGCHHAFDCQQFESLCHSCPRARPVFKGIIKNNFNSKLHIYRMIHNMQITAPSKWLLELSKKSKLLGRYNHVKINNPIEDSWFGKPINSRRINQVNNKTRNLIIGFSALNANLSSKGILNFMETFNTVYQKYNLDFGYEFHIIGEFSKRYNEKNLKVSGKILSTDGLINEYKKIDIFINPSHSENSPLNIIEAGALGIPTLCRKIGGMTELVLDGINGYSFSEPDDALAKIIKLLPTKLYTIISNNARDLSKENHSSLKIANNFLELYSN
jgi:glycosyltransferase involved in cell wall biosynthesis